MFYDHGDPISLAIDTLNAAGQPADPGAVALTITHPDDTSVTYTTNTAPVTVTRVDPGRYELTGLVASQVGRHYYRWVATGANASSYGPDLFDVRATVGGALLSLTQARKALNKSGADEEELRETIDAATAPIEDIIGAVAPRSVVEVHHRSQYPVLVLRSWPPIALVSLEPVQAEGTSYPPADLDLDPELGIARRMDGGHFLGPLRVTYRVGRRVVDPSITESAKVLVRHMWELQRAGRGSRAGIGQDPDDVVPTPSGFLVPRRVSELLHPFRRPPNSP